MTDREIFDRVKRHLLTQGERAWGGDNCRYRAYDGLKCAVGCLITDSAYNPAIEGYTMQWMRVNEEKWVAWNGGGGNDPAYALAEALNLSGIPARATTRNLLVRLQSIHDESLVSEWPDRLDYLQKELFPEEAP